MNLKHIVPGVVARKLRPGVHRFRQMRNRVTQYVTELPYWPHCSHWHSLRQRLEEVRALHDLYCCAADEFGILQIEEEVLGLLEYIRDCRPSCVAEIGLKYGGNTFLFMRTFESAQQFIGIDLRLQNISKLRLVARPGQQLDVIQGSSYSAAVLRDLFRLLGNRHLDFLFIDGDHAYEGVRADFAAYYHVVRPGGRIAFHDIVPDEFARTGKCQERLRYGGGVYRLWQQLKPHFEYREFVQDWNQDGFGIGVVTKPLTSEASSKSLTHFMEQSS